MKVDMFLVNHFWKADEGILHYFYILKKVVTSMHMMQKHWLDSDYENETDHTIW